jgi:hypothetical protein
MALNKGVFGFFYRIGSLDYPSNYNPDEPFGFVGTANDRRGPIFNYSVNDVEKSFMSCRTLVKPSFFTHVPNGSMTVGSGVSSDVLLADSTGEYSDITNIDLQNTDWDNAFKVVEFLYDNQSNSFGPAPSGYTNWADQMLSSEYKPGASEPNVFYVNRYVPHSLVLEHRGDDLYPEGRLVKVRYIIKFTGNVNVEFNIYFDANEFMLRYDNLTYAVYRYEDLDDNDQISPSEMYNQIILKQFNMLKNGKYKQVKEYFVNKRLDDSTIVREQFFIYSTLSIDVTPITNAIAEQNIKDYLLGIYDMDYLKYHYPELFTDTTVHLIPVYDNGRRQINDNSYNIAHGITIATVASTLQRLGFNMSSGSSYKPIEIFHIGPGQNSNYNLLFPIIAVEYDSSSVYESPITDRFPTYRPIYGADEDNEDATLFHGILLKLLNYITETIKVLEDSFVELWKVKIIEEEGKLYIEFTFEDTVWVLYGP